MIDFQNATVLDYSQINNYFGESFRYASKKSISIQGLLYAPTNYSGVAQIWSGISGFVASAIDYDAIVINGANFGNGRIDSINFEDSNDVRIKKYTASLSIFDSGSLFNLTGTYYNGLNLEDANFPIKAVDSFTENFDFTINEKKQGEFTHSINVRYISGAQFGISNSPKTMARLLASGLVFNSPTYQLLNTQYSGFYHTGVKKYVTETYDEITNECSFTFTSSLYSGNNAYSFFYTNSLNVDAEGITTVSENGNIKGEIVDLYTHAEAGFSAEIGNTYARCNGLYTYYQNAGTLNSEKLSLQKSINKFEGTIDYNIAYSDNPNLANNYIWEYNQEITQVEPCIYSVSEQGSVIGRNTNCGFNLMYSNALAGWTTIKSNIASRSTLYYKTATNSNKTLKNILKSEGTSKLRGRIDYSYNFTDSSVANVGGFRKVEYTVDDTNPTTMVSKVQIAGVKELVQPAYNTNLGERKISLDIIGSHDKTLTNYLTYSKTLLNTLQPVGGDVFINNTQYNYSPPTNTFSIQVGWTFFSARDFANVTL